MVNLGSYTPGLPSHPALNEPWGPGASRARVYGGRPSTYHRKWSVSMRPARSGFVARQGPLGPAGPRTPESG